MQTHLQMVHLILQIFQPLWESEPRLPETGGYVVKATWERVPARREWPSLESPVTESPLVGQQPPFISGIFAGACIATFGRGVRCTGPGSPVKFTHEAGGLGRDSGNDYGTPAGTRVTKVPVMSRETTLLSSWGRSF